MISKCHMRMNCHRTHTIIITILQLTNYKRVKIIKVEREEIEIKKNEDAVNLIP